MCDLPGRWTSSTEQAMMVDPERAKELQGRLNQESRQLTNASKMSRGYYPLNYVKGKSKGKKGKSSGKGRKGPAGGQVFANHASGKGGKNRVGEADYTGCFISEDKNHEFRTCPRRGAAGGKGQSGGGFGNFVMGVFMVEEEFTVETTTPDAEIFSVMAQRHPGHAVLDSGATEKVASLEALEELMKVRAQRHGPERFEVVPTRKRFQFGNGESKLAESLVIISQLRNKKSFGLAVCSLDVKAVPILLSVRTLKELGTILDFERKELRLQAIGSNFATRHLLLDLTADWLEVTPGQVSRGTREREWMSEGLEHGGDPARERQSGIHGPPDVCGPSSQPTGMKTCSKFDPENKPEDVTTWEAAGGQKLGRRERQHRRSTT